MNTSLSQSLEECFPCSNAERQEDFWKKIGLQTWKHHQEWREWERDVRKMPHYYEENQGAMLVFFCNDQYIKTYTVKPVAVLEDDALRLFYSKLSQHPEVEEIRCSTSKTYRPLLCNSPHWEDGHKKCVGCPHKQEGLNGDKAARSKDATQRRN